MEIVCFLVGGRGDTHTAFRFIYNAHKCIILSLSIAECQTRIKSYIVHIMRGTQPYYLHAYTLHAERELLHTKMCIGLNLKIQIIQLNTLLYCSLYLFFNKILTSNERRLKPIGDHLES